VADVCAVILAELFYLRRFSAETDACYATQQADHMFHGYAGEKMFAKLKQKLAYPARFCYHGSHKATSSCASMPLPHTGIIPHFMGCFICISIAFIVSFSVFFHLENIL
jgi:hypothetical protein